ncbi:MAG: hypothetical protein J6U22_01120 [Bacteroidaceae bacterium]|nr:hypothetical protein [Bacteroidaceae bacterium]
MAKIILKKAFDGSCTDVNDLDIEVTTPSQIIGAAVENGILDRIPGEEYKVIGKNNQPIMDDKPLAKLGFKDGDTLTVVSKPQGAVG